MPVERVPGVEGLEPIGRGGSATVHKGHQRELDRWVAVKLIPLTDEATIRRFDRERRAMGRLSQHPAIATIYSSGITPDHLGYLVMPLFERSLQAHLTERGALSWREAIDLFLPIADAVSHAHREDVLHLDLKPSNVLLDADNRPFVADFGLASLLEEGQPSVLSALSPAYASPEAIDSGTRSRSSDVYGLGATLHAMLTGTAPYSAAPGDARSVFERIAADPVPTIGGVPSELADAVRRAMAKAPEDRWRTVEEFSSAVRAAAGIPVPRGASPRRERWIAGAWVAAAIAVTATGLAIAKGGGDPGSSPTTAVAPATTPTTPSTSAGSTAPAPVAAPTTTPTTTTYPLPEVLAIPLGGLLQPPALDADVVWAVRDTLDGEGSLIRLSRASGAVTDVVKVGNRPRGPAVTDDAVWVFNVVDGTVSRVDRETRVVTDTVDLELGELEVESPIDGFSAQAIVAGHGAVWVSTGRTGVVVKLDATRLTTEYFWLHEGVSIPGFRGTIAPPLVTETDVWIVGQSDRCSACTDLARLPFGNEPEEAELELPIGTATLPPVALPDGRLLIVSLGENAWAYLADPGTGAVDQVGGVIEGWPSSVVMLGDAAFIGTAQGTLHRLARGSDGSWSLVAWASGLGDIGPLGSDGELVWLIDEASGSLLAVDSAGVPVTVLTWPGLTGLPVLGEGEVWIGSGGELVRVKPHG